MDTSKILVDVGTNFAHDFGPGYDIVHCIEPNPIICEYLRRNTNYHIHEFAVDNFIGKHSFGISKIVDNHQRMGCSSLYDFTDEINGWTRMREDFTFIDKIEVNVITMEKFIEDNNIPYISLFKCDAQGSDLNILKSFGKYINIIEEGVVEVANTVSLYKNVDNTFGSTLLFLTSNNFEITNWDFINTHPDKPELDINFRKKVG